MKAYFREDQIILLDVLAARHNTTMKGALTILLKALRDEALRKEIQQILGQIEKRGRFKQIWIGDYTVIKKIAKSHRKPAWYVLDILIKAIEKDPEIFYSAFPYIRLLV